MGIISEFKAFAIKGNVVDMAVGVIIGTSFGKIVTSLVNDIIMPPISLLTGDKGFGEKFVTFSKIDYPTIAKAKEAGVAVFAYGSFIQTIIDFTILAFIIFLMVKGINRLKKKEEAAPAAPAEPTTTEILLTEIRDSLKK